MLTLTAILTTALLSLAPGNGDTPRTEAPKANTQTLTLRSGQGGQLLLDGQPTRDTTFVLTDAHVATRTGAGAFSVALPDGRVFYKGDVELVIQSKETGTVKIALVGGEAVLASSAEE